MSETHVVSALQDKRDIIKSAIAAYERELAKARSDLANVNAVLAMYGREINPESASAKISIAMVFKRGEIFAICKAALAGTSEGLDTRQLAACVLTAKGLDAGDAILRRSIAYNVVQTLGSRLKRRSIKSSGKRGGVRIWIL